MKANKILSIILGAAILLSAVPMGVANASTYIGGKIQSVSCPNTLYIKSVNGSYQVDMDSNTVITVNGAAATCNDLQVGMDAQAVGEVENGVLKASRVAAVKPVVSAPFVFSGAIVALDCPNSMTLDTGAETVRINISQATIYVNGVKASCTSLKVGMSVETSGIEVNGDYKAQVVDAQGKLNFNLMGVIKALDCPKITIASGNSVYTIDSSSASIFINMVASSCSDLRVGDTINANGEIVDGKFIALSINVTRTVQSFTFSGKIVSTSCPNSLVLSVNGQNVTIDVSGASFYKDGKSSSCVDLKPGDTAIVTGKKDGGFIATSVDARSPQKQAFNYTGKIKTLNCDTSLVLQSGNGAITIDIAQAAIYLNGKAAKCSDLLVGDTANVSGYIENEKPVANLVAVNRSTQPPPQPVAINGKVTAVDCSAGKVTVFGADSKTYIVMLAPPIIRNGVAANCGDIKVGDTAQIVAVTSNGVLVSTQAVFTGSSEPDPGEEGLVQGQIKAVDCMAKKIVVVTTSGSVVTIAIEAGTIITVDGSPAICTDLKVGYPIEATGIVKQGILYANKIVAASLDPPQTWEFIVSSVNCISKKLFINDDIGMITIDISKAIIKKNGQTIPCESIAAGDKIKVEGHVVQGELLITAILVEVLESTGVECNGPFTLTGKVVDMQCANNFITILVGEKTYVIFINENTKFYIDGIAVYCQDIKVGMTVTIKGNCADDKRTATEISNVSGETETKTLTGELMTAMCTKKVLLVHVEGVGAIEITIDDKTVITINGVLAKCESLIPGMKVKITYKVVTINNVTKKVAVKVEATYTPPPGGDPNPPPGGGGGGGGGGTPPQPPGGGGSSGGGSGSGSAFESVITITKVDCEKGTIEGTDEYNAGAKVSFSTKGVTFTYKGQPVTCDKIKVGYLLKVKGTRGSGTEVKTQNVDVLPVSPVPTSITGRIIEVNKDKGIITIETIETKNAIVPQSNRISLAKTITITVDPKTTFDYRGKKLTIEDLKPGIILTLNGAVDPVTNSLTTNAISLSARQATDVTQKGTVTDVFCDKNMFWITKSDTPETKYVLIKITAGTEITMDGKKVTCADLVAGASITVDGKLDPFDMFITAGKIDFKVATQDVKTIQGEFAAVDTAKQFIWVKTTDANGTVMFVQVRYNPDTKFLAFGKTGSVADLTYASQLTITGLPDATNQFVFHATTVESLGKAEENLTVEGTVVFTDCVGKVIFIKTAKGVERYEITSATKLLAGDKDATCADIKENDKVTLVFDRKGTKVFVTKLTMPSAKTVIKLTVGLGVANVNGQNSLIDSPPYVKNGTTMVPVRVVTTYFGASLDWNNSDKRLTIRRGKDVVICWIGRPEALVNGKSTPLSVAPEYGENSRMMVPLRFFSEAFGAEVKWDQTTKTVTIIL